MNIDQILDNIYTLPHDSKLKFMQYFTEVNEPKGKILLKAHQIENYFYFLKKGIARAYSHINDSEITFWFGLEGDAIISMQNYVAQQSSYEHVELLENCVLYKISFKDLQQLFLDDIHVANWGRKFAEKELVKVEERLISHQFKSATERYIELLNSHSDLIQRVQLGHIASYLGITQVSLSRIRSEIR